MTAAERIANALRAAEDLLNKWESEG